MLTNSVHQFSLLDLYMLRAPAEACARNEKFEKQLELAGAFPRVPALCVQRVGETMCQRLAMRGWGRVMEASIINNNIASAAARRRLRLLRRLL